MADDPNKRGRQDRNKIAANQPYEVNYFKNKHGITKEQALKIIKRHGNDRDAANEAADRLNKNK